MVKRPVWPTPGARWVCLALGLTVVSGCAAGQDSLVVVGTVNTELVTIQAPTLEWPRPNLDAGFAPSSTARASGAKAGASGATSAATSDLARRSDDPARVLSGWSTRAPLKSVEVSQGQRVSAGQVVARFDVSALRAAVAARQADEAVATARRGVLEAAIEKTSTAEADLNANRAKVATALATATRARTDLVAKRAQATRAQADLSAKLAAARAALAKLQALAAGPNAPDPAQLQAQIAQLRAGIAQLTNGLAQVRVGITRINAGLAKIEAGQAKATSALGQMDRGLERIVEGRATLRRQRPLVDVAIEAAATATAQARRQEELATLTAPVDGIVVDVANPGDLLAPGAAVVTIRPSTRPAATAWLSPDQLGRTCVGATARVSGDWMAPGQGYAAAVSRIGDAATYPPTSQATQEVHLTRAVQVEVTVTSGGPPDATDGTSTDTDGDLANREATTLPPGVPVEITLQPCPAGSSPQAAATSSAQPSSPAPASQQAQASPSAQPSSPASARPQAPASSPAPASPLAPKEAS